MDILSRAYQSVSRLEFSSLSQYQSIFSRLSPTQQKILIITAVAMAAIATIVITVSCCFRRSSTISGLPPYVPPQPYVQPYQQPYQQPYYGGQGNIGGIPGQQGHGEPLVSDTSLQDLLEIEQEIAKLRAELKEEQEVVDLQHAQRAEFGLDDETLNALLDEDLDTPKDPAPPKDPDEKILRIPLM